eukprot:gnl/Chilomastix_cuspidata/6728.p1 GENE.gnl/Chilomastix_cuspidata/6728~~gnl/Chilomastix_cuspidata/6728.p1  ORF type:complete len:124 (+),score=3.07 gnl/Chilomastix_cuspidata/6728:241-612(+)
MLPFAHEGTPLSATPADDAPCCKTTLKLTVLAAARMLVAAACVYLLHAHELSIHEAVYSAAVALGVVLAEVADTSKLTNKDVPHAAELARLELTDVRGAARRCAQSRLMWSTATAVPQLLASF